MTERSAPVNRVVIPFLNCFLKKRTPERFSGTRFGWPVKSPDILVFCAIGSDYGQRLVLALVNVCMCHV